MMTRTCVRVGVTKPSRHGFEQADQTDQFDTMHGCIVFGTGVGAGVGGTGVGGGVGAGVGNGVGDGVGGGVWCCCRLAT
jgi:hypothetical protein